MCVQVIFFIYLNSQLFFSIMSKYIYNVIKKLPHLCVYRFLKCIKVLNLNTIYITYNIIACLAYMCEKMMANNKGAYIGKTKITKKEKSITFPKTFMGFYLHLLYIIMFLIKFMPQQQFYMKFQSFVQRNEVSRQMTCLQS